MNEYLSRAMHRRMSEDIFKTMQEQCPQALGGKQFTSGGFVSGPVDIHVNKKNGVRKMAESAKQLIRSWFKANDCPVNPEPTQDAEPQSWGERVESWADDRNLLLGSDPASQLGKLLEEVGELASGIAKDDDLEIADAIGDCAVVLCIIAAQLGLSFAECQEGAWQEIKDRKGSMIDGVFVKED